MVIKILRRASLGGEVKPAVPCRKILRHEVYSLLVDKIHGHSPQVSPASVLGVSTGYCRRALLGKSGMMRTLMGTHNRSVMIAVYGTPCAIPPREQ
jgi:hypothetical protein